MSSKFAIEDPVVADVYGSVRERRNPLASWIWGARIRSDQQWMDYLIEFLCVFSGFAEALGVGVDDGSAFERAGRLGLRRFAFYDENERKQHDADDIAINQLNTRLKENIVVDGTDEKLDVLRDLLRSLAAVRDGRSWLTKTIFPAHESMLMWEALAQKRKKGEVDDTALDRGISLAERAVFARGGELYYLLLSLGSKDDQPLRSRLEARLATLIRGYPVLGGLASIIDEEWQKNSSSGGLVGLEGRLGWIPNTAEPHARIVAQDVDRLLSASMDPLEQTELLARAIAVHTVVHVMRQAGAAEAGPTEPYPILIDAVGAGLANRIRQVASLQYQQQPLRFEKAARSHLLRVITSLVETTPTRELIAEKGISELAGLLADRYEVFKDRRERFVEQIGAELGPSPLANLGAVADIALRQFEPDFSKRFSSTFNRITKATGLARPIGRGARLVLDGPNLRLMVLLLVEPAERIPVEEFFQRMYSRYGFVIGPDEASLAGIDIDRMNATHNAVAFTNSLAESGLLIQFSDATAMVSNPFEVRK